MSLTERDVQDFAVTIAALLAGRCDGQQAVATTAAQVEAIVARRVAAAVQATTERVLALAQEWEQGVFPITREHARQIRAALAPYPCGHVATIQNGCGGCDPGATDEHESRFTDPTHPDKAVESGTYQQPTLGTLHWPPGVTDKAVES